MNMMKLLTTTTLTLGLSASAWAQSTSTSTLGDFRQSLVESPFSLSVTDILETANAEKNNEKKQGAYDTFENYLDLQASYEVNPNVVIGWLSELETDYNNQPSAGVDKQRTYWAVHELSATFRNLLNEADHGVNLWTKASYGTFTDHVVRNDLVQADGAFDGRLYVSKSFSDNFSVLTMARWTDYLSNGASQGSSISQRARLYVIPEYRFSPMVAASLMLRQTTKISKENNESNDLRIQPTVQLTFSPSVYLTAYGITQYKALTNGYDTAKKNDAANWGIGTEFGLTAF